MRSAAFTWIACAALVAGIAHAAPPTLAGCAMFPANNVWNTRVDTLPVHPSSATYINSIGATIGMHPDFGAGLYNGGPIGIPYVVVDGTQPKVPVAFDYADESDPGPYPIPPNAPIEGGAQSTGDRHILVVDRTNCKLYETFSTYPNGSGGWTAGSGAIFDLKSHALRPDTWTSADAAGLPILPGLVRYDEVAAGEIAHALRFTVPRTQRAYVWPARHLASTRTDPTLPPMGLRLRLKASVNLSPFSPQVRVILSALQRYGMMVADNGSAWYLSGAPDDRWNNDMLVSELARIKGSDFEVVDASSLIVDANSGEARQAASVVDLALSASAATLSPPTQATTGRDVVYTFNVSNLGNSTNAATTLTLQAPASSARVWASPGCTLVAGITCNVGAIAPGANAAFTLVLRPSATGTLDVSGTLALADANTANNSASAGVTVQASTPGSVVNRYRLYSPVTLEHLFTTDANEYAVLGARGWLQEGIDHRVYNNPATLGAVSTVPYYRVYILPLRQHLWTTDANEYYTLRQSPGAYQVEGIDGFVFMQAAPGTVALYRMYYAPNPALGLHHWTRDTNEYNVLTTQRGWVGEAAPGLPAGVAAYVLP